MPDKVKHNTLIGPIVLEKGGLNTLVFSELDV